MAPARLLAAAALASLITLCAAQQTVIGIIGDWGFSPDGYPTSGSVSQQNQYYQYQNLVAQALGAQCQTSGCHLVLGTGDNFYEYGISSSVGVMDPQWKSGWQNVYSHAALQNIPFYHCLGNHDYASSNYLVNFTDGDPTATPLTHYNSSIWPQIEYTWFDPQQRWKMPGRYYNVSITNVPVPFGLTVMDSGPYLFGNCCDNSSSVMNLTNGVDGWTTPNGPVDAYTGLNCSGSYNNNPEMAYGCQNTQRDAQAAWAKESLQNFRSQGLWNIFMSHYPMINIGDGMVSPWAFFVQNIMNAGGATPHFAFNGHEHVLAVEQNLLVNQTVFSTVGASGNVQSSLKNSALGLYATSGYYKPCSYTKGTTLFYPTNCIWKFQAAYSGFGILTLNATHGKLDLYGALLTVNVNNAFTLLYSITTPKF
jgi:hypothetical protein